MQQNLIWKLIHLPFPFPKVSRTKVLECLLRSERYFPKPQSLVTWVEN